MSIFHIYSYMSPFCKWEVKKKRQEEKRKRGDNLKGILVLRFSLFQVSDPKPENLVQRKWYQAIHENPI